MSNNRSDAFVLKSSLDTHTHQRYIYIRYLTHMLKRVLMPRGKNVQIISKL